VFDKHKSPDSDSISKKKTKDALEEIGFFFQNDEIEQLFESLDMDGNGTLDLKEFKFAASRSSKTVREIEGWTASFPFSQLAAACFIPFVENYRPPNNKDVRPQAVNKSALEIISECADADFSVACEKMLLEGFKPLLSKHLKKLQAAYTAQRKSDEKKGKEDEQSKFSINTMSCGEIDAFYEGLGGRVGITSKYGVAESSPQNRF
jgi:hypothetical protein